ncbi:sodium- and chloride-dependent glycine transporter 1-like [Liolophura sinensis]|uniref:sodium- and chloride-dependent glycine transporter 1-like n=1 Tax=Liolophura sinensis TaxID=3198878 RepID=UPI003158D89A
MLALAGLPLFFMELSFGQFSSLGPITIWKISPLFKGIGYCMVIISILVDIYYNVIIGWSFYFLFRSFTSVLPWSHCDNDWNTEMCVEIGNLNSSRVQNITDKLCQVALKANPLANCSVPKFSTPSEEFWKRHVLNQTDGLHDIGTLRWQTTLCLILAWTVIFLCLAKGVKSSGKVVYFTATFPYVVLLILLVRGCTLEGSLDGIIFYLTPKWEYLLRAQTWAVAATQIFYSLGPAFGGLITMASYNRFNNNCYRDALIVAILNCATSVFAGFVIFSLIGFMARMMNRDPSKVVDQGPGLAFIVYPEGIAQMPISPLWSVLFFAMLLTLGVGSQFVMVENVISAIVDEYPVLRTRKTWVTLVTCVVMCLLGLPICTQGGIYLFVLMENYTAGFSLLTVAFLECVVLCWVYGYNNFAADIEMMLGFKPNIFWRICWSFLTPAILLAIMVFSFVQYAPSVYNEYVFPAWGEAIGWLMMFCSIVLIPAFMVTQYCRSVGFVQSCSKVVTHRSDWGPALEKHRALDLRYKAPLGTDACAMGQKSKSDATVERTSKEMKDVLETDYGKDNLTFANDHL